MVPYCRKHDIFDCWFEHTAHELSQQYQQDRRWIDVQFFERDDFYQDWDTPSLTVMTNSGKLAVAIPIIDNRDAYVGTRYQIAPPSQQYAFRLQQHRTLQALCDHQAAVAELCDEPF